MEAGKLTVNKAIRLFFRYLPNELVGFAFNGEGVIRVNSFPTLKRLKLQPS